MKKLKDRLKQSWITYVQFVSGQLQEDSKHFCVMGLVGGGSIDSVGFLLIRLPIEGLPGESVNFLGFAKTVVGMT